MGSIDLERRDATDIAVIIPCYNDGQTVREAVASAAVDHPSEIIVIDDGSNDPLTLEVLSDLQSSGIRVIQQENGGLAAARMTAVNATNCPFVAPLDADDLLEPGALIDLAAALDDDPEADVAFGDFTLFGSVDGYRRGFGWDPWMICYANRIPGGGVVLRRQALLGAGGWVLENGYEDWDLWMSLLERNARAVHVPRVTFRYRQAKGRLADSSLERHPQLFETLMRRHASLFEQRRPNWGLSSAPLPVRFLLPCIASTPGLSLTFRHRLAVFFVDPVPVVKLKLQRVLATLRRSSTPRRAVLTQGPVDTQ